MSKLDDVLDQLQEAYDTDRAYFGERLLDLIDDIGDVCASHAERIRKLEEQLETSQKERLALLEASKAQSAEITTRDGATRKAAIGQVVLCKCAKYGGAWTTAIIQEVYGFPPGKVGVRLLGRTPTQDSFEITQYDVHGYHAGPTWKWLDE